MYIDIDSYVPGMFNNAHVHGSAIIHIRTNAELVDSSYSCMGSMDNCSLTINSRKDGSSVGSSSL